MLSLSCVSNRLQRTKYDNDDDDTGAIDSKIYVASNIRYIDSLLPTAL